MIIFEMPAPNGALARYHRIAKWEMTSEYTRAIVNSYHSAEMVNISWQDEYTIPLEWKISTIDDIEFILTAPGAPMAGGSIVPDTVETLSCAQARKWAEVKIERDRRRYGTFTAAFGTIQIDEASLSALRNARLLIMAEGSTIPWTLADNTAATITLDDANAALLASIQYQTDVHILSQAIRDEIDAAETVEAVQALGVDGYPWPVASVAVEEEDETLG
ncbi:DUF4376 domain-containing protein [Novosphingobium guangzhouense]|uniref:DUF4376 domain-containing protein n=1 Tax=Novosphingobium guangzhouense TaxID=1850347 RepID=A0A2K2G373_9SPHN|nr:DUF4376 domain-containing protein [Novosphingobium guangzhouense]PNU05484.1 hypothetical protein A8V01_15985 [Novosphingobium guangzhouense]